MVLISLAGILTLQFLGLGGMRVNVMALKRCGYLPKCTTRNTVLKTPPHLLRRRQTLRMRA